jgi:hypothetical protein
MATEIESLRWSAYRNPIAFRLSAKSLSRRHEILTSTRLLRRKHSHARRDPNPMLYRKIPWLLIGAVSLFGLVFVYRRGVDVNWDLRNYHYFNGYSLVHWRYDTDIAPQGHEWFLNPILCAFFYLLLSSVPFPADAWILAALQLSSLPILVLICREIDRELGHEVSSPAGWLALCLCLAAPIWWSELGTTFYSSTTAPLVLLGLLFGLRGVRMASSAPPARILFALAGGAIGLACGLKLTNAPFAVSLLLALAIVLFPLGAGIAVRRLSSYVGGLVAGFAPTSWWNVFLFWRWGSPLFPYYNSIFRSPYYPAVNFRDLRFEFHSLPELTNFLFEATRETRKTLELPFADARLLIFVVLMLVVLVAWVLKRLASPQNHLRQFANEGHRHVPMVCFNEFRSLGASVCLRTILDPDRIAVGNRNLDSGGTDGGGSASYRRDDDNFPDRKLGHDRGAGLGSLDGPTGPAQFCRNRHLRQSRLDTSGLSGLRKVDDLHLAISES